MINKENHIGKISVSKNYITETVRHAVCECFGVADVCNTNTFQTAISSITHGRLFKHRGVVIRKDKDRITVDLHIKVSYGTNIQTVVKSIIHNVRFTMEETAGIRISNVNVFVYDMNE